MINLDLTNMILKIYQTDLINKMTQLFNKDVKSLMNFNTPATAHKGIERIQEKDTKYQTTYKRDTEVVYNHYYTLPSTHNPNYLTR